MGYVFISYSHKDVEFVTELEARLASEKIQTWIDKSNLQAGLKWREEIDARIREASALVLVVTAEALRSEYVNYEWIFALGAFSSNSKKEVIPILREDVKLPYRLEDIQYIDFRKESKWDDLLEKLKPFAKRPLVQPRVVRTERRFDR